MPHSARPRHRRLAALLLGLLAATALPLTVAVPSLADPSPPAARVPAGRIPARLALRITGDPASAAYVRSRIEAALAAAIEPSLTPGSRARVSAIRPAVQPLGQGFLTEFSTEVQIDPGPGAAPVTGIATVDVVNAQAGGFSPRVLAFADDPERIAADGVLSRTVVALDVPTRLYYYHENVGAPRRFCIVFSANGSVLTHLQVVSASAGPSRDVMSVGDAASRTFLARQPVDEGRVIDLHGGRPVLERDVLIDPGEGIVGSLDLRVLFGGPVTVTVLAVPPASDPLSALYGPVLPPDGHQRHGNFGLEDFAQRVVAYTVGGPDATYVYGRRDVTPVNLDPIDLGHDYGDYGVLQRVAFDVLNPTGRPATVYLYERPRGGAARSSFLVDGTAIDVGCVRVANRYLIAARDVAPGRTDRIDVRTMTAGGSNLPLEIGLTTTPPLAQTPALDAADGCFPKPGGPAAAAQPTPRPPGR